MKEKKPNRSQRLYFRVSVEEREEIERRLSATTCRNISEYGRKVIMKKPLVKRVRDDTKEELLNEISALRKEFYAIGSNDQLEAWFLAYEDDRNGFLAQMENIDAELTKLALKWWQ